MENRKDELKGSIEALLFSAGKAVRLDELAKATGQELKEVKKAVGEMEVAYHAADRGIRLKRLEDACQLCTKEEYYQTLIRYLSRPKSHSLSQAMLEVLSIIAYKQPVTRQEIEKIRGVRCGHAINKLIEYSLVCEVGRLDAVGRPILFGTTEEFLRCFGIDSLTSLPGLPEEKIHDFKLEAEQEICNCSEPSKIS